MIAPTHTDIAPHYVWGNDCDGWRLADGDTLSVIEEIMPSDTGETPHRHAKARQFFYVLAGIAVMEINDETLMLGAGWGIEVPPGTRHRLCNQSDCPLRFLVISAPTTRGDRVEAVTENDA